METKNKVTIGETEFELDLNGKLIDILKVVKGTKEIFMTIDYFLQPIIHRVIKLNDAIVMLLQANNYEAVLPLIRPLMEHANYMCAYTLCNDYDVFFRRILQGKPINQLRADDGKQMTTNYLVDKVTENFPAFRRIWDQGNKYIHPSEGAIKAMINVEFDDEGNPTYIWHRGLNDEVFTNDEKKQILIEIACVIEAIHCYAEKIMIIKLQNVECARKAEDIPPTEDTRRESAEKWEEVKEKALKPLGGGALVNPLFNKDGK